MRIKNILGLLVLLLPVLALAELNVPIDLEALAGGCPVAMLQEADRTIYAWPQKFADGRRDLVMADQQQLAAGDFKRVTFGVGKAEECGFLAIAIVKGGDWGWHLAWSTTKGVFYARMDGEAWVSSPVKKLGITPSSKLQLLAEGSELKLDWESGKALSQDEGRSWD